MKTKRPLTGLLTAPRQPSAQNSNIKITNRKLSEKMFCHSGLPIKTWNAKKFLCLIKEASAGSLLKSQNFL